MDFEHMIKDAVKCAHRWCEERVVCSLTREDETPGLVHGTSTNSPRVCPASYEFCSRLLANSHIMFLSVYNGGAEGGRQHVKSGAHTVASAGKMQRLNEAKQLR